MRRRPLSMSSSFFKLSCTCMQYYSPFVPYNSVKVRGQQVCATFSKFTFALTFVCENFSIRLREYVCAIFFFSGKNGVDHDESTQRVQVHNAYNVRPKLMYSFMNCDLEVQTCANGLCLVSSQLTKRLA